MESLWWLLPLLLALVAAQGEQQLPAGGIEGHGAAWLHLPTGERALFQPLTAAIVPVKGAMRRCSTPCWPASWGWVCC